jgi:hypothetical protein
MLPDDSSAYFELSYVYEGHVDEQELFLVAVRMAVKADDPRGGSRAWLSSLSRMNACPDWTILGRFLVRNSPFSGTYACRLHLSSMA